MSRVLVLWCPDWPVVAAQQEGGLPGRRPTAVVAANLVQACNAQAREHGVRRGMRRRDAQTRCPDLTVLPASPERDARVFESVLAVLEESCPGVAPLRPGLVALRSSIRRQQHEPEAAALLAERVVGLGIWDVRIGIADEIFTAEQAARRAGVQEHLVIAPQESPDFLRGLPVDVLGVPEAVSLMRRLGLRTLADLTALPERDVRDRLGAQVAWVRGLVHGPDRRQAHRESGRALSVRTPPPELAREVVFEPGLESAETVCFSTRRIADEFVGALSQQHLVGTEVRIEVECQAQVVSARTWLHPSWFSAAELIDRLHWQLNGSRIPEPVDLVRFVPLTVVPEAVHAEGLWGGGTDERVARGIARVQGLVGHEAVLFPVLQGGRMPADRQALVPWGERPTGLRPAGLPWPGRIPAPFPTRVLSDPWPATVQGSDGAPVGVDERGGVTGDPYRFQARRDGTGPDGAWRPVAAWAGPWPVEELWWESRGRRMARFQMVGSDGSAWLMTWSEGGWWTEAGYD